MKSDEELSYYDYVELVKSFLFLPGQIECQGESKAVVTARNRIQWIKYREWEELLYEGKLSLKMKGRIYQSFVRWTMLCGSEKWCLMESEMAILK